MRNSKEDDSDDSDVDIITTKKPRIEQCNTNENQPYTSYVYQPIGHIAEWVVRAGTKFHDFFYVPTIMNRPKGYKHISYPTHSMEITIDDDDDDDDDEPIVVYEAVSLHKAAQVSSSLLRPPLGRKSASVIFDGKKGNDDKSCHYASGRNLSRHDFIKPESVSLHNKWKSAPRKSVSRKTSLISIPHQGSTRTLMERQVDKQHWKGTTAAASIRLAERETYRQLLESYSPSHVLSPSKSDSTFLNQTNRVSSAQNSWTEKKPPVLKQKLSNSFREDLEEKCMKRLQSSVKANQELPDVVWVQSCSLEATIIERKVPIPVSRSTVLREIPSPQIENDECQIVTPLTESKPRDLTNLIRKCPYVKDSWLSGKRNEYQLSDDIAKQRITRQEAKVRALEEQRDNELKLKTESLLHLNDVPEIEEVNEIEAVDVLPELTSAMLDKIENALHPSPPGEVLVNAFQLRITRRDMETLAGLNWLNDEIINFYFNLLMERGKQDNFPSVYSCNTFFYPKLLSGGHASLKRWTRKIDIFAHDLMLVPVHLGMHWCLAVVDFRAKKISYYDSMSGQNQQCLQLLKAYLEAESQDKKKQKLDMSQWSYDTIKDKPHQLNGSDCGMFTCIYAEHISRNAKLTFSQEDMPYFRKRMVYEILTVRLL